MRHALAVIACFVAVALLVRPAAAAEKYLGTVIVTDAGAVHNLFPTDGGAFSIAPNSLLTIQPNASAYVCVDELDATKSPVCTATNGVLVSSGTAFPSSCASGTGVLMADGGFVTSCIVTCRPSSGASVNCPVWLRTGKEF